VEALGKSHAEGNVSGLASGPVWRRRRRMSLSWQSGSGPMIGSEIKWTISQELGCRNPGYLVE
jgi:hypothetical protein